MRQTIGERGRRGRALGLTVALLALPALAQAGADGGVPGARPSAPPAPAMAPDSPRATVLRFLELAQAGRYAEAAQLLDVPEERAADAAVLAQRLKVVLDHTPLRPERLSPLPRGNERDGLPAGVDQVTRFKGPRGDSKPVLLERDEQDREWRFSRATVEQIDDWYEQLGDSWAMKHLPAPLLRPGARGLLWWQWIALVLITTIGVLGGLLLGAATRYGLGRLVARAGATWAEALVRRLRGPIALAWALALIFLQLPLLSLDRTAEAFVQQTLSTALFVIFFWALLRAVDVISRVLVTSPWAKAHPASRSLVPLGARTANVAVVAIGIIGVLSGFGYPVASLIAGLGIGGLAIALAGQKTMENLFGAFAIGLDQPFREGDYVKIDDVEGTVEVIGLRSTRIRTPDRTLVSIPNGKLAELRTESYSVRDRIRLACTVGLVYGTTAAQMHAVLAGLARVLRAHPKIWPDSMQVTFSELGASALNITVVAWFQTTSSDEFQLIRQEILLQFMEVVEKAGTQLAFPTQTVHVVQDRPPARP